MKSRCQKRRRRPKLSKAERRKKREENQKKRAEEDAIRRRQWEEEKKRDQREKEERIKYRLRYPVPPEHGELWKIWTPDQTMKVTSGKVCFGATFDIYTSGKHGKAVDFASEKRTNMVVAKNGTWNAYKLVGKGKAHCWHVPENYEAGWFICHKDAGDPVLELRRMIYNTFPDSNGGHDIDRYYRTMPHHRELKYIIVQYAIGFMLHLECDDYPESEDDTKVKAKKPKKTEKNSRAHYDCGGYESERYDTDSSSDEDYVPSDEDVMEDEASDYSDTEISNGNVFHQKKGETKQNSCYDSETEDASDSYGDCDCHFNMYSYEDREEAMLQMRMEEETRQLGLCVVDFEDSKRTAKHWTNAIKGMGTIGDLHIGRLAYDENGSCKAILLTGSYVKFQEVYFNGGTEPLGEEKWGPGLESPPQPNHHITEFFQPIQSFKSMIRTNHRITEFFRPVL